MAPNPLWRAKSVAGLCDTQAAGTLWHSMGPPQKLVNGARALWGGGAICITICALRLWGKALTVTQHLVQDATGH